MIKDRDIPHRKTFEEEFSVAHVRFLAESRTDEVGPAARAWLSELRDNREAEAASKRDAREERTLAISERALSISKEANRIATEDLAQARKQAKWAKWAAIIATGKYGDSIHNSNNKMHQTRPVNSDVEPVGKRKIL